jgi:hypothetical protein
MVSTKKDDFSILFKNDGATFGVRTFFMTALEALARFAYLDQSPDIFGGKLSKHEIKSFLEKYEVRHDSKKDEMEIISLRPENGVGVARVGSATEPTSYMTTFPYLAKNSSQSLMFGNFYDCTCPLPRPRNIDLQFCPHTAYAEIYAANMKEAQGCGFNSHKVLDIAAGSISTLISDKKMSRQEIYDSLDKKKNSFRKVFKDEFLYGLAR